MATIKTKTQKTTPRAKRAAKSAPVGAEHAKVRDVKNETSETKLNVYAQDGTIVRAVALPREIFGLPWRADLVHQVVVAMQANARPTVANTKTRGEVAGGGKKPWKQKGTGRARHGSTRSPIWVGGGIAHGPRAERSYAQKINKKMRVAALFSALSKKARDNEIILVEKLSFDAPSTKSAKAALVAIASSANAPALATKARNAALVAFAKKDAVAEKSFRNIGNIDIDEARNLNPVAALAHRYLVIENPDDAFAMLLTRAKQ